MPQETLNGHEVRSQRSTRALTRAAGELIAENGYQAMTLAMVGERAGYSRSLATARFGSKAKLLEALVDEIAVRWSLEKIEPEAEALPGIQGLHTLLTGIQDSYRKTPHSLLVLYALLFEALGPVPELRERFVTFHRRMRAGIAATIRRGILDGSIRSDVDADEQATAIVAQLRGVAYLWKLDPETTDPARTLSLFLDQCMSHLAVNPRKGRFREVGR
ncbi:HTH-type transcriptional regulator BetI [Microbacterium trichothecenolyticum]|uniref:HTH-type transcriptional regulator BetI n=2 Tax=Microbacterium trichothecenolyticum TaxID=69370 RepID=A0A0M2HCD3_MICTR|nr:HTH-type transcriptional regulator BetI [Microbacterium trichothecenolyticum]